jgi:hypothetical protein
MKRFLKNILLTYPVKFFTATSSTFAGMVTLTRENRTAQAKRIMRIVNGLFFMALVFSGDRFFTSALQFINDKSHFRFSKIYNTTGESDIVLIGNSRGHTLYQPAIRRLTGSRTINLSYNALPASLANALILDYYDRHRAPGKLIVEVSMLNKAESNVINEFKLYINHSDRIREVIRNNSPRTATAVSLVNLYSFNTELFHRSLYYMGREDIDWILDKKINKGLVNNTGRLEPITFQITEDRLRDLSSLVTKAREENTEVTLVLAPYYPAYIKKITNLNGFISTIESRTGLKVHNYGSLVREEEFFSDYLHLNKAGSVVFMKKLKEDGIL